MFDAIIVGAGLAGLACACDLHEKGLSILVLEASDAVGGAPAPITSTASSSIAVFKSC